MNKPTLILLAAVIAVTVFGCSPADIANPDWTTGPTVSDISQTSKINLGSETYSSPPPSSPLTLPPTTLPPITMPLTLPPATMPPPTPPPVTLPPATMPSTTTPGTSSGSKPQDVKGVMVLGDRAMEHYYGGKSGLAAYAKSINTLKSRLPNVNVYALMAPTSIEFNCPPEYKKGDASQRETMIYWYSQMSAEVLGVDSWSELNAHRDEYLYYRTDTHWAQRGAYYAYRAFCYTAGFTPYELSAYESGAVPNFLGYLYTYTKAKALKDNPDIVEYFRPVNPSTMMIYQGPAMTGGYSVPVISSPKPNYYMFIGGDNPISHIVSATVKNGKKLIVTKDSYGNALVPFLTDHFEEIYVIDQRYFNASGKPSLNIVNFAVKHGVTDILVFANAFNASSTNSTFQKLLTAP